jgi:tripartite-type tricarboxylate transporter receptor subunit TctC
MILAPANTPNNIIQYLEVSISQAIKTPELREQLSNNGVTVINGGPNEANKLLQSEYKRWTKLISLSGATLD